MQKVLVDSFSQNLFWWLREYWHWDKALGSRRRFVLLNDLELQRVILPILTTIFPNIQFVVTTHSPFILNSLENAVAFDLEHREPIEDLTDYSYEALAEGYFGVRSDSSEIQMRLQRMEELIRSDRLSISDKSELEMYLQDFDKIPEAVAPAIKAKYYDLKREWQNKN